MLVQALFIVAVLAAGSPPSPAAPSKATKAEKRTRYVELTDGDEGKFHEVFTHPNVPAKVELPEGFVGTPTCGSCVSGDSPELVNSDALFVVDFFPGEKFFVIRPAGKSKEEGGTVPRSKYVVALTVRLKSEVTVGLTVKYGSMEQAQPRIVFKAPDRTADSEFVRAAMAKEKANYARQVEAGVKDALLSSMLEPHSCVARSDRTWRDRLVVEVNELCRFGANVFIRFTVENQGRESVVLGDLDVQARINGSHPASLEVTGRRYTREDLAFDTKAEGVVAIEIPDASVRASDFTLRVLEKGGAAREVVVANLNF